MSFFPRSRFGVIWRTLLAGILVIGFSAGAAATYGLLKVKEVAVELGKNPSLKNAGTTLPKPGKPETLLLVGSDARYNQGAGESNTDTMMLVRIDDSSSTINMLSVPRDLEVKIHGNTAKLNSAWSSGGPNLLIQTLKQQVFPGLQVNHIINIDFGGFAALINAIGGVYTMVDHRYYNANIGTIATDFSSIDIQPGYQRLTGGAGNSGDASSALAFVRFRHSDNDLVREARQQDFIRWAKSQFSTSKLVNQEDSLIATIGKHISTDSNFDTTNGLLELADLAINANGHQIKSFYFPATSYPTINGTDYVASTPAAMAKVYKEFMTPTKIAAPSKSTGGSGSSTSTSTSTSTTSGSGSKSGTTSTPSGGHHHATTKWRLPGGMINDVSGGKQQATALGQLALPVYYPKYVPDGSYYCLSALTGTGDDNDCGLSFEPASAYAHSYPRAYHIHGSDDALYASYVMTLQFPNMQDVFFNVQGTTWRNPPILRSPTKVVTVNGRTLKEFYNGTGNLSLVSWSTPEGVYWIANSLQDVIPPAQMVAMAATLTPAA